MKMMRKSRIHYRIYIILKFKNIYYINATLESWLEITLKNGQNAH